MDTREVTAQTEEMRAEDKERRLLTQIVDDYLLKTHTSKRELARRAGLSQQWLSKYFGPHPRGQLTLYRINRLAGAVNVEPFWLMEVLGLTSIPGPTASPSLPPVLQQLAEAAQRLPVEQQWALIWAARGLKEQQGFTAKPNPKHPRCRTCGLRGKPADRLSVNGQCYRCEIEAHGLLPEVVKPR